MTPLIFISFLVSLALVDLRHSALRAHYHADADGASSRLPRWLHRLVYRYRGYRYDFDDAAARAAGRPATPSSSPRSEGQAGSGDYYHSKQRKLMKMEAAEAFEIRGWVLVVLGLLGASVLWAAWKVGAWGWGAVSRLWVF